MNALERLVHDLRGFATEVHTLGYSRSVVGGAEGEFFELSERMLHSADAVNPSLWRQSSA